MADLAAKYTFSQDVTFLGRVAMAAEAKAMAIASESSAGLAPPRKRLAVKVLADPIGEAKGLAMVLVQNATIAALPVLDNTTCTDAMINNALSDAVWDGYAQAFA